VRTCTTTRFLPAAVTLAVAALIAAAAAGALLAAAGLSLVNAPVPRDALPATPRTAAELLVHNARVVLWPLALVWLDWPRHRLTRCAGDALAAGQLAGHGALVGAALAQQPELWRYLPHLPVEWLAIALPAAAWFSARARRDRPAGRVMLGLAAAVMALLVVAAILETYAVPL
jgi:hypothetical protein